MVIPEARPQNGPSVQVWKFSDPTAVLEGMQVIDQDVISLGK
jgi:hypothetical protein